MGPNLTVGADGKLYLSWLEPAGEAHALRFAAWEGGGWSEPRQVASGASQPPGNGADSPHPNLFPANLSPANPTRFSRHLPALAMN